MKVVSESIRMLTLRALSWRVRSSRRHPLDLLDRAAGGLVQRDAAIGVVDAVELEDLEALLLPGAGNAEDCDLLGRILAQLEAGFDDPPGDDVHARVRDDRHH